MEGIRDLIQGRYVKRSLLQEDNFCKSVAKLEEQRQEVATSLESIAIGQVLDQGIKGKDILMEG